MIHSGIQLANFRSCHFIFMELNKLKLSAGKCSKIHIGKKCEQCPKLMVHENEMKSSQKEKYLGDIISEKGTSKDNIENRIAKAWSYVAEISAIINEFPFGNKKIQVGLMLRDSMFLNGVLHSSEAWHGVTAAQIAQLEVVDHHLMRTILSAQAKTPIEFLYLETGALPVKYVMMSRRLNFLKHIHMQAEHELLKRVFLAQKEAPKKGDWWETVKDDLIKLNITEDDIKEKKKVEAKKYIKHQIYTLAFEELKKRQATHKKINCIKYEKLERQKYLESKELTLKEACMLVALRSHSVKEIKTNFKTFNKDDLLCPLCLRNEDTQEHCLECPKLKNIAENTNENIDYDHIYSDNVLAQKRVAAQFLLLLEERDRLLQAGLPGA